MSEHTLDITREDGLVICQLNRPSVRNAIDAQMVGELHDLAADLERNPATLIVTGCTLEDGKGIFASGADIGQLRARRRDDALLGVNSTIFSRLAKLPMPVIAAIDGYALGGGLELALAADFRIATNRVKLGQPETNLGIIAGAGALWRLTQIVGEPVAKEIVLAGRILDAQEASQLHLVNEVCEPDQLMDRARKLAERIAAQDPLAVRLSKAVMAMPAAAHPHVDNIAQAICFESEAKFDRMQAFLDRKKRK